MHPSPPKPPLLQERRSTILYILRQVPYKITSPPKEGDEDERKSQVVAQFRNRLVKLAAFESLWLFF